MLVAVYMAVTLAAWGLANRHTETLIRFKEALRDRETGVWHDPSRWQRLALAYGLTLLETGVPPEHALEGDPPTYRCVVEINPPSLEPTKPYTLTFQLLDQEESQWSVTVAPWNPDTDADLEPPVSFEDISAAEG